VFVRYHDDWSYAWCWSDHRGPIFSPGKYQTKAEAKDALWEVVKD